MADEEDSEDEPKKKGSKLPLILSLVIGLGGGGGAFFAIYSGMLFGSDANEEMVEEVVEEVGIPDVAFVPVDPLLIGIGHGTAERHLRFRAQLEVPKPVQAEVEKVLPRVVDVMNTYLRAVEITDLEDPAALVRLRAQLLRRVQVVTGQTRVRDLLIMEFVVS